MRSILTLSFIACIFSATFALNDQQVNKRDVDQILKPVTGGGIGSIGTFKSFDGLFSGSVGKQNKRDLPLVGSLPLVGGLVGGATGGSEPAAAASRQEVPHGKSRHQGHRQKRSIESKRDLPLVGSLPLVGGLVGGATGGSEPAAAASRQGAPKGKPESSRWQ
jgi:hypothetical protein